MTRPNLRVKSGHDATGAAPAGEGVQLEPRHVVGTNLVGASSKIFRMAVVVQHTSIC
ncbi:hypothetical protein ACL02S_02195 [Nocardia sp. 004]|uniref:hypothetical protein n=1 Tax=Nocardia sp. 004 TaxID=3385978 RepID=UPI0039A05914